MAVVNPFKKYNYKVTIEGKTVGAFSEVSAPDFNAAGNEIAVEILELAHEGVTQDQ